MKLIHMKPRNQRRAEPVLRLPRTDDDWFGPIGDTMNRRARLDIYRTRARQWMWVNNIRELSYVLLQQR